MDTTRDLAFALLVALYLRTKKAMDLIPQSDVIIACFVFMCFLSCYAIPVISNSLPLYLSRLWYMVHGTQSSLRSISTNSLCAFVAEIGRKVQIHKILKAFHHFLISLNKKTSINN